MAAVLMTKLFIVAVVLASAGVSHGQTCVTDQSAIFSEVVSCVVQKHPEYLLTVLTKMDKPESMQSPDFMCQHSDLMAAVVDCFLQYMEKCVPAEVAKQVSAVMPTHASVLKGVTFICEHRKAFEDQCVEQHVMDLTSCFRNKLSAFSFTASRAAAGHNIQDILCKVLEVEEKCMKTSLRDCPASASDTLIEGLLSFFPKEKCPQDNTLRFLPGRPH